MAGPVAQGSLRHAQILIKSVALFDLSATLPASMSPPTEQDQFSVVSEEARRIVIAVLRKGYENAEERYIEGIGCNGSTFGTDLYHMIWSGLAKSRELEQLGFHYEEQGNRKRLLLGSSVIACHKIAPFVPKNVLLEVAVAPKVSRRKARQLGLPFPGREELYEFDSTCTLVIAHYGNAEDGCLGIYLQVPATTDAKDGVWAAAQSLWIPSDDAPSDDNSTNRTVRVAAEVITPPVVRRKKRDLA
jgi:hypothetical protein